MSDVGRTVTVCTGLLSLLILGAVLLRFRRSSTRAQRSGPPDRRGHGERRPSSGGAEAVLAPGSGRIGRLTDDVTGLRDRESFDEILKDEAGRAARADRALGLLVIGMDALPAIRAGDAEVAAEAILRQAARRLSAAIRDSDIIARYGPEEFAVLLLGAGPEVLLDVADRCRRSVAGRYFELADGARIPVTVSVGGATRPTHAHAAGELVAVAESALDRAREAGRNCLHIGLFARLPVAELTDVAG